MGFKTSLQDVQFVGDYYDEYLSHIDRYKNLKRPSIFCRYLKVNKDASVFHSDIKGTDSRFYDGVHYDSYEYTPAYLTGQRTDNSKDNQEKMGRRFSGGETELIVYTINKPNHNDLIMFPYAPNNSMSCYRIVTINTALNALNKDIKYTRLSIEKAPVDHNLLKYLNSYVYLMPQEYYVPTQKYLRIMKEYEKFTEIFSTLKPFFNDKYELYYYEYNGNVISPLKQNQIIYNFLTSRRHNTRYFTDVKIPFGIKNYSENQIDDSSGFDIINKKITEMGETNNPIILGYLSFLNKMLFPSISFKVQYYYFVNGKPEYGLDVPIEYSDNIEKYEINPSTLLMDFGVLIPHFKG